MSLSLSTPLQKKIAYARCRLPSFLAKSKGTIKEVPFSLLKTEEMLMSARVRGAIFSLMTT